MSIECFYNSNVFEIWKKIASENRKESNYKKMEDTSDRLVFCDNSFRVKIQYKLSIVVMLKLFRDTSRYVQIA